MTNNCAFTIVAKNYVGLALVLEQSIKRYYNNLDFYIFVADELNNDETYPQNVIESKHILDIKDELWQNMSFKYNITEFCTSIKPAVFLHLINEYEKVIYLDPDILFFNNIEAIYKLLDNNLIILTPHITQITEISCSDSPENTWLRSGIFNLGFCGLKKSSQAVKMLKWWKQRLINNCFDDEPTHTFTDQKWIDFLPAFFNSNELLIIRDLGYNLAPWNFFERKVQLINQTYYVTSRINSTEKDIYPLLFVHYSGYNYKALMEDHTIQKNIENLPDYNDIHLILDYYKEFLKKNKDQILKFLKLSYTYNFYDNGVPIQNFHRRLYRSLCDKNVYIKDPFSCSKDSFFTLIKQKNIIANSKINIDKTTSKDINNISNKLRIINKCSRIVFKILGYNKYILLLRFLKVYSRFESQIHLLNKKYDSNNI